MRWLQWSTIDLENGLGGVEVHARALDRELRKLGIETGFSRDPADLLGEGWDVVQTHGSAIPAVFPRLAKKALHLHTAHGTTLGRMRACGEWLWPGGYAAAFRETSAVCRADIVLFVRPGLGQEALARKLGKETAICWNGWDAPDEIPALGEEKADLRWLGTEGEPRAWAYIGRGADPVKGADRLKRILDLLPEIQVLAAPGEGFEDEPRVGRTGALTPDEVRGLLLTSKGLILPSRYEGNALVVLEALAHGVPVVSAPVGAAGHFPPGVQGLVVAASGEPEAITEALQEALRLPATKESRKSRAEANRKLLPSWKNVAEIALDAVEKRMRKTSRGT